MDKAKNSTPVIKIHVTPDARREKIEVVGENELRISVREPAQGNGANTRVREIIATRYTVAPSSVRIVRGHRSPTKYIDILRV